MKGRKNDEENGKVYTPEKIGLGGGWWGFWEVGFFLRFSSQRMGRGGFLFDGKGRQASTSEYGTRDRLLLGCSLCLQKQRHCNKTIVFISKQNFHVI